MLQGLGAMSNVKRLAMLVVVLSCISVASNSMAQVGELSDAAAQFLLATLYDSGHGVPMDPLRACALYDRASVPETSPFATEAQRLLRGLALTHDNDWFEECQTLANVGFDHRFEPATFDLGPDSWVSWSLTGATVSDHGSNKHVPWRLAPRRGSLRKVGARISSAVDLRKTCAASKRSG